jgi:hypothetical protein
MRVPRAGFPALFLLPLLAAACSSLSRQADDSSARTASQASPAVGADAGLEVTTFISGLDERTLAIALSPYADQPLPISHDLEDLWDAHGLRMVSLPIEEAQAMVAKLQTGGGSQRQWLGQAYSWTEAARGNEFGAGRVIALDAERIRLSAGSLRLLVRSWVEAVPPEPRVGVVSGGGSGLGAANDLPSAVLRVELVPQHRELHPDESTRNPLAISEPKIEAESQGLLFSRLYARMTVPAGRALLILPERPGANWRRLSQQPDPTPPPPPPEKKAAASSTPDNPWPKRAPSPVAPKRADDEWSKLRPAKSEPADAAPAGAPPAPAPAKPAKPPASGAPRLGEVIRGPIAASEPPPGADNALSDNPLDPGPAQIRVATLGEAMLAQSSVIDWGHGKGKSPESVQRTMILLIPRVPREFHLLGPTLPVTPQGNEAPTPRASASPARPSSPIAE